MAIEMGNWVEAMQKGGMVGKRGNWVGESCFSFGISLLERVLNNRGIAISSCKRSSLITN